MEKVMLTAVFRGELEPGFVRVFMAANWLLLAVLVAGTALLGTQAIASGVLAGGVLANLNCLGLDRDCQRMVRWKSMGVYYAGMAVRLALVCLAVTVCLIFFGSWISPVGIFMGLSVAVLNFYLVVLGMLFYRFRFKEAA
jgi:hypothetical protein